MKRCDMWQASKLSEQVDNLESALKELERNRHIRQDEPRKVMYLDISYHEDGSGNNHMIPEKLEVNFNELYALLSKQRDVAKAKLLDLGVTE